MQKQLLSTALAYLFGLSACGVGGTEEQHVDSLLEAKSANPPGRTGGGTATQQPPKVLVLPQKPPVVVIPARPPVVVIPAQVGGKVTFINRRTSDGTLGVKVTTYTWTNLTWVPTVRKSGVDKGKEVSFDFSPGQRVEVAVWDSKGYLPIKFDVTAPRVVGDKTILRVIVSDPAVPPPVPPPEPGTTPTPPKRQVDSEDDSATLEGADDVASLDVAEPSNVGGACLQEPIEEIAEEPDSGAKCEDDCTEFECSVTFAPAE